MIEVRIHGRGGQGAVVAAELLASAFFREGKYVQSFPTFGPERRAAPVAAFVRVDEEPIKLRCEIYNPDHLIVLDASLVRAIDITAGVKEGGWVVINSGKPPESFDLGDRFRVVTVDAGAVAVKHKLGSRTQPIANTAILGSFARITGLVGIDAVVGAIEEMVSTKKEENVAAARETYDRS